MSSITASKVQDEEPWGVQQKVRMAVLILALYAVSPPMIIVLSRSSGAPIWFMHSLEFFYAPIAYVRETIPMIDNFYEAYRVLMRPWLTGI